MSMETSLVLIVVSIGSLLSCVYFWKFYKTEKLSNNEKVFKMLEKKHKSKIWEKSNWNFKITFGGRKGGGGGMKYHKFQGGGGGNFQSNINHWQKDKWGKDALE